LCVDKLVTTAGARSATSRQRCAGPKSFPCVAQDKDRFMTPPYFPDECRIQRHQGSVVNRAQRIEPGSGDGGVGGSNWSGLVPVVYRRVWLGIIAVESLAGLHAKVPLLYQGFEETRRPVVRVARL
jgi:hypothetical protein